MGSDIRLPFRTSSQFPRTLSLVSPSGLERPVPDTDRNLLPAIFLLFFAYFSDKLQLRWPFIFVGLVSSAAGFSINLSNAPIGVKYFGTFLCVAGTYSTVPGIVAW